MRINDIFEVVSGKRIIEEDIYIHCGNFPCVTAQTENEGIAWYVDENWIKSNYNLAIFGNIPVITWTKDGAKCGTVFYRDYEFFCTDVCGVLIIKEKYKKELNLKWFKMYLQTIIQPYISSQETQGKLYNQAMSNIEINYPFPPIESQIEIVEQFEKINTLETLITDEIDKIKEILLYELELDNYVSLMMSEIAILNKGSNRISEEMIYKNYDCKGIPVYSSATENEGLMGMVSQKCYDEFHKQGKDKELTWTTNGYAGKVFYRNTNYLYSEKCGRIVIRQQYQNKILPKYLCYMLNQITYKYKTSESNNGKLDIIHMENIPVKIPINSDGAIDVACQDKIIKLYEQLDGYIEKLSSVKGKITQ